MRNQKSSQRLTLSGLLLTDYGILRAVARRQLRRERRLARTHQHCNRNDVAESDPGSADQPITKVEPQQSVREARENYTKALQKSTGDRHDLGSFAIQPKPAKKSCTAKHEDADGERQRYFRDAPSELFGERSAKYAPRVHCAQCDLEEK